MKWHDYEDKINLYLDQKWSNFLDSILKIVKKSVLVLKEQVSSLSTIDIKAKIETLKSQIYNLIHYIQENRKKFLPYLKSTFLNFWENKRKVKSLLFLGFAIVFSYLSQDRLRIILDLKEKASRSPASTSRNLRPSYYNQEKKQITIYRFLFLNEVILNIFYSFRFFCL